MYETNGMISGVKTVVAGLITTATSMIIKSKFLPSLLETMKEQSTNTGIEETLPLICTILTTIGTMLVVMGVFRMTTSLINGDTGYGYTKDENYDDYIVLDGEDEEEDGERLVSMDDMLLSDEPIEKFSEYNEKLSSNNNQEFTALPNNEDVNEDETMAKKIRPKNEAKPQMIKCSFCGRQKEMGSICKRCKTC